MWQLNGTRIIVQEKSEGAKRIIARLQPLSGGTINHFFGYETKSYKLNGIVVGDTDKNALIALAQAGTTYTLVTPYGNVTVSVGDVSTDQMSIIYQSLILDGSHDCLDPVYKITIGLIT